MAFQFIPNADGSFDEGMRQTNTETGVEYIYTDGAWRPLGPKIEDQFDELDARYLKREGIEEFTGDLRLMPPDDGISRIRVMKANTPNQLNITSHPFTGGALSNAKSHIIIKNVKDANGDDVPETKINFVPTPTQDHHAVNKAYVDDNALSGDFLPITGGTLTNPLMFQRGSKDTPQFKISPNSSEDWATNIYSFNNGQMRFRTTIDTTENPYETHIILDGNDGEPETKIYKVVTPTKDDMAANKGYVDNVSKVLPPGLRYRYRSQTVVNEGQMAYYSDGGNLRLRISNTSRDIIWNTAGPIADVAYDEGHLFTIYYLGNSGNWNIIRQGTINRIDWHANDILCYISSHQSNGSFGTDRDYYVTISGLC